MDAAEMKARAYCLCVGLDFDPRAPVGGSERWEVVAGSLWGAVDKLAPPLESPKSLPSEKKGGGK